MHTSNVFSAWILSAHDRLAAVGTAAELDQRQIEVLTLVSAHPGYSIEWLRPRIGLTQSGTVRLVDRLEAGGLLERRRSGGRAVELHLTELGRGRLEQWRHGRDRVVDELLGGMPAEHRRAVVEGFEVALRAESRVRAQADRACRTCDWPACGADCPVDLSVGPE